MRINNNIMAMNTHRQYSINTASVSKSTEKLSSGYRINRAGDDAAGLAISEKMRAQIRGLTMASKNSSDAISLVQTAEGALQETHNILQRMRELAVQSASDTNEQTIDRAALQAEFEQLQKEIDDISTTTRFNDQNLLDGTFQSLRSTINTTGTTLENANVISVARAKAGDYTMNVSTTQAKNAETIPNSGQAAVIDDSFLTAMANMSTAVDKVSFSGLETSAHNGNKYTLKVSGTDIDNMTFTLIDSNEKEVATTHGVKAGNWKVGAGADAAANTVSFEGVGTFTFEINQTLTKPTHIDGLNTAEVEFNYDGTVYESTATLADATLTDVATDINASLDAGTLAVAYVAPTDGSEEIDIISKTDTAAKFTFDYSMDKDGNLSVSLLQDGKELAKGTASIAGIEVGTPSEIDFGAYGKITLTASTATTALKEVFPSTVEDATPTAGIAGAIETAVDGAIAGATITVSEQAGTGTHNYTSATSGGAAGDFEYTYAMDDSGNLTVSVFAKGGTDALATDTVAITRDDTVTLDLGAFGKFDVAASDDALGAITAITETAKADYDVTAAITSDAGVTGATPVPNKTSAAAAATVTAPQETQQTGGKEQEVTSASRAFMTLTINGESVNLYKGDTYVNFASQGIAFEFDALSDADIANADYFGTGGTANISVNTSNGQSLVIQTGANEGDELSINIDRIGTETLGINYSNISTREAASEAITAVNNAINKVSSQRAELGALQNRLDHKIANLDTSAENLQAAESRIRDLDMAKEMTTFTRNNILVQASTAMLAQANAAPQGVLQLLG